MKATDLIHNGIYLVDGKLARFWALNGRFYPYDRIHHICMVYADQKSGEIEGAKLDGQKYIPMKIEPVPITAEILEKNGFEMALPKIEYFDMLVAGKPLVIEKSLEKWHVRYGGCSNYVSNVHELQRALGCCGLDGLADDLKI